MTISHSSIIQKKTQWESKEADLIRVNISSEDTYNIDINPARESFVAYFGLYATDL